MVVLPAVSLSHKWAQIKALEFLVSYIQICFVHAVIIQAVAL